LTSCAGPIDKQSRPPCGASASEIIHIGQAIMSQPRAQNTVRYFVISMFNYPTMAEAYRVAALNGLNRLF
jgi:NAD(P) transhydrogenase